jgi:hypothetical protein
MTLAKPKYFQWSKNDHRFQGNGAPREPKTKTSKPPNIFMNAIFVDSKFHQITQKKAMF